MWQPSIRRGLKGIIHRFRNNHGIAARLVLPLSTTCERTEISLSETVTNTLTITRKPMKPHDTWIERNQGFAPPRYPGILAVLDSDSSSRKGVEVQVLSSAQKQLIAKALLVTDIVVLNCMLNDRFYRRNLHDRHS